MDCFSEYIPLVILLILGTWAVETVDAKYNNYCGCCPCYVLPDKCSCYHSATSIDTVPPQLHQCPNNLPQRTVASGSNTAVVCWTEPWASDNKHPSFITPKREGPKPCSSFPEGTYTVKYTATDHSKNSAFCQFSFSVKVTKCPVLSHPMNGRIVCDGKSVRGTRCEYSCTKGYQLAPGSGPATRICRDNGDWSGSEVQCVPLTCPVLQPPMDGAISCEGISAGCKCTYTCQSGYFMVTGSRHRYCTADRQWTGAEPVCRRAQCPTLNSPPFSSMSCTAGNDIGSVCTYTCRSGYYLMAGSDTRSCSNEAYWSGSAAVCRPITCDPLPMPNNARMMCSGKNYGDTCNFQCLTGFELASGSASRVCSLNGEWSGSQPECSAITCNSLTAAPYSTMLCNGNTYGRKCEYRCNSGYKMISGSPNRICGLNGLFSGSMPVCEAIKCQGQVVPSYVDMRCNGDTFGSVCQYQCANGYKAVGGLASRSCEANGQWSGSQLQCELIECPPLERARKSRDAEGAGTTIICQGGNRYGARCEYRCNQGYRMTSGSKYRVCGLDGQWSGEPGVCTLIICPQLDAPSSGYVRCTAGNQVNSRCDYFCDRGYYVSSGSSSRVCGYSGSWSGTEATCDMVECPAMELSQNSNCLVVCTGKIVGSRCLYQVPTNYEMIGRPERVCELNGRWSGSEPICQEIVTCENLPSPPNGLVHCLALPPVMSPGSSCQYQCHENYKITAGSQIRVCKNDGQWSGEEVTCTKILVQCRPLGNPTSGTIQCTDRSTEGSICRYACNEGYERLGGTEQRECLSTGQWSGSEPICIARLVTCPPVKYPINCNVRCCPSPFQKGCVCNYKCVSGYEMVSGSSQRECTKDGSWTGNAPTCSQIASVSQCPAVNQPDNCHMTCCSKKKYSAGCNCQFQCVNGYQLMGPSTITCNSQGKWSSSSPVCSSSVQYAQSESKCQSLNSPSHCSLQCSSSVMSPGQQCTYNCNKGYHAVGGSTTRSCGADGQWSGYQPSCQPIYNNRCSHQKKVSHTNMQCSGCYYSGCRCSFKCDTGYEMAYGSQTRVCVNGQWTGMEPTCQKPTPTPCPVIGPPENAEIRCSCTNSPGCVCEYDCDLGYTNAGGSKTRTCETDGQWSGTEPVCFPVAATCEPLNAPENGKIQCYGGNFHGARCNYTCDSDFYISSGTYIRHCSNGMWSGSVPTCSSRTHCLPSIFSQKNWNCESDSDGSGCVYGCNENSEDNNHDESARSKREIEQLENKLTFSDAEIDDDEIINI